MILCTLERVSPLAKTRTISAPCGHHSRARRRTSVRALWRVPPVSACSRSEEPTRPLRPPVGRGRRAARGPLDARQARAPAGGSGHPPPLLAKCGEHVLGIEPEELFLLGADLMDVDMIIARGHK